MKRILIATEVPFWLRRKGNQQRIFELVSFLAETFSVTVFLLGRDPPEESLANVSFVAADPYSTGKSMAWKFLNSLPSRIRSRLISLLNRLGYRRKLSAFYNPRLVEEFHRVLESAACEAVIIEYIWYGYLADAVDRARSTAYLDVHDIFHRRIEGYARFGRVPDKFVTREQEMEIYRKFDRLIAIQQAEFDYLAALFPGKVLLAMHPHDPHADSYLHRLSVVGADDRLVLVYFASFGDLNVDAIEWFVSEVWTDSLADKCMLRIYGQICDALKFDLPGVQLMGQVDDVDEVYREADIAINPARFGSGLKIKNVEALAFGVPLVTTTIGAEGIESGDGIFYLCADNPGQFRDQILSLSDPSVRRTMSGKALAYVRENLSRERCFGLLRSEIEGATRERK